MGMFARGSLKSFTVGPKKVDGDLYQAVTAALEFVEPEYTTAMAAELAVLQRGDAKPVQIGDVLTRGRVTAFVSKPKKAEGEIVQAVVVTVEILDADYKTDDVARLAGIQGGTDTAIRIGDPGSEATGGDGGALAEIDPAVAAAGAEGVED